MSTQAEKDLVYSKWKWRRLRDRLVRESGYRCSECRRRYPSRLLRGHHIVPVQEDPELAFDPDNVTILCCHCHEREHHVAWQTKRQSRGLKRGWQDLLSQGIDEL